MGDKETTNPTNADPGPVTRSVTDSSSTAPSGGPMFTRDDVFAPDGSSWRDKFHGREGHIQQLKKEHESTLNKVQSEMEQKVNELTSTLQSRNEMARVLQNKVSEQEKRLEELNTLADQVPELEKQAKTAERFRSIMEYPELLNLQVTDTIQDDEGEEHEVVVNPVLDLIENTTLEGENLRTQIKRLHSAWSAGQTQSQPPASEGGMTGAAPAPGEPVDDTIESLQAEAEKWRKLANSNPGNPEYLDNMMEAYDKVREAEANLQS